ncbi:MAG: hypothetical protein HY698_06890 [Deltaproteobacteria bacterium]|nr:hypothetical protein [Deltaproteobacteria bacterium]
MAYKPAAREWGGRTAVLASGSGVAASATDDGASGGVASGACPASSEGLASAGCPAPGHPMRDAPPDGRMDSGITVSSPRAMVAETGPPSHAGATTPPRVVQAHEYASARTVTCPAGSPRRTSVLGPPGVTSKIFSTVSCPAT